MIYRFTYTHNVEGSFQFSEPEGWKDTKLGFERHPAFHSLVEFFKSSPFSLYGSNGTQNGARDFVKNIEDTYGPDETIDVLIEGSDDEGYTYDTVFSGIIAIATLNEIIDLDHQIQIDFTNDEFWKKIISRFETQVNLKSTTDLDGNAISATPSITNSFPAQLIRYNALYTLDESYQFVGSGSKLSSYYSFYWPTEQESDIKTSGSFDLPDTLDDIIPIFRAPWDGSYRIEISFIAARLQIPALPSTPYWEPPGVSAGFGADMHFYVTKKQEILNPIQLTRTLIFGNIGYQFTLDETFQLKAGESIIMYGDDSSNNVSLRMTIISNTRWQYSNCRVATTDQITLSGLQTIDGVTVIANDRVLVKDQEDKSENGIYVAASGSWSRATDMDAASEFNLKAVYIEEGDSYTDNSFKQKNTITTVGVDPVEFVFSFTNDERYLSYASTLQSTPNYIQITADTTFPITTAEGFLVHDAANGIIERITGDEDAFYSEYYGSQTETSITYASDGCGWERGLFKGLNIRGKTLTEKPFSMSLREWFDGMNPIDNIGLGLELNGSVYRVRVEPKEHFYDSSSMSTLFSNVSKISRNYDNDYFFNKVKIGYKKWRGEGVSSLDDPQTTRTYASIFKNIGKPIEILSDLVTASITTEIVRRNTVKKSESDNYDDDTFLLSIRKYATSYFPKLDEDFSSITNLINSSTRYNNDLTPARNMIRHLNFLSGCLQSYLSSVFRFVSGEGNYDMTSTTSTGCPGDNGGSSLSEKGNISVSSSYLFIPELYKIEHTMTLAQYNVIKAAPNNAIGISLTDTDHKAFFIKNLEYSPELGQCTILAWPKERFPLSVVQ